jgi:hypothetical protein
MIQLKPTVKITMHGRELHLKITGAARSVLGRVAGRLRIQARRSLKAVAAKRARKNPSRPGQPPHSIRDKVAGHRMRMILYAENRPMEWVIGPRLLTSKSRTTGTPTPAIHEHGGSKTQTIYTIQKVRKSTTARQRKAFRDKVRRGEIQYSKKQLVQMGRATKSTKRITYPKRPFMLPALKKLAPQIPAMFANKLKK